MIRGRKREWDFMDVPNKRYPDGYLPKISYWMKRWEAATEDLNEKEMKNAEDKLMYFFGRQLELKEKDETI